MSWNESRGYQPQHNASRPSGSNQYYEQAQQSSWTQQQRGNANRQGVPAANGSRYNSQAGSSRKIQTKFLGTRRDARQNFGIRLVFDEILIENGIEMQGKS